MLHGAFYALSGHQEHRATSDVHAVIGDALQVVDHQGGPHAPLRSAAIGGWVGDQVHRLGVQEVHFVVGDLEVPGAVYVTGAEYLHPLVEEPAGGPGHLDQGRLEILVPLAPRGVDEGVADVFGEVPERTRWLVTACTV